MENGSKLPEHLIVVEEEISYTPSVSTYKKVLALVNQFFYGAPEVPLDATCSMGHFDAASLAIRSRRFRIRLTYNELGEIVGKEFVE